MSRSIWFLETRPQFLTLSVALILHGSALAYWQGSFDWLRFILALVALVLMQAAVNVLNDWHDYKTGIDLQVNRTPFSGGSGLLPAGTVSTRGALVLGIGTLSVGFGIGLYLVSVTGWPLLVIGAIGAFTIVAYTPVLSRMWIGEIMAGIGAGYLPIVGVFYVMTESLAPPVWIAALPAFFLTYNLLLLNEFPDVEADRAGGRHHMVTTLGKSRAAVLYTVLEITVYIAIVLGVLVGGLTPWALLGLGGLVLAIKAIKGALKDHDDFERLIPAQGANVMAVLLTNVLLGVGYLVAAIIG